jgi:hypothetical protein
MRKLNNLFYLSIAACLFTGCQKVVNTNLHDAASKYVIEGVVTNAGACSVLISSTTNVSNDNIFKGISGALVQIRDNDSAAVTLPEKTAGVYGTTAIKGVCGHTYRLTVTIKEAVFTAVSTMPKQVALDAVAVSQQSISGKSLLVAIANYTDPEESGNYYNFVEYINQSQQPANFVNSDNLSNGRAVSFPLLSPLTMQTDNIDNIHKGDTVRVEMQCIDANVYKYWYSLNAGASGSDVLTTPANPVSNIVGEALGYFSAHTAQTKKVIVK